ncbi:hypothetical protein J6590_071502 [Homalodisca vitripennis]|nr:hypothetical protein J6590_071502 [Homalodisca vitripennis]
MTSPQGRHEKRARVGPPAMQRRLYTSTFCQCCYCLPQTRKLSAALNRECSTIQTRLRNVSAMNHSAMVYFSNDSVKPPRSLRGKDVRQKRLANRDTLHKIGTNIDTFAYRTERLEHIMSATETYITRRQWTVDSLFLPHSPLHTGHGHSCSTGGIIHNSRRTF